MNYHLAKLEMRKAAY